MFKHLQSIKFSFLFKYSVAAILLVIPLYPKFPVFSVPGTYVAIRAEDFLISFIGIIYLIHYLMLEKRNFFSEKINIAILLFILCGFVSMLSGVFLTKTISLQIGILHWVRRIEYLVPFFVAVASIKSGHYVKYYLHTIILVGFLAFLYGVGQVNFDFPVIATQNEEYSKGVALRWVPGARLPSTFAGHYDLAAFLVLSFPLAFGYLFYLKSNTKRFILVLGYMLPVYWLFLQTEARVSFIAAILGICSTLYIIQKKKYIIPVVVVSIIGMLLFSSLGARYLRTINFYKPKIISTILVKPALAYEDNITLNQTTASPIGEDRSFSIRLNVEWPRAVRAFMKNPLLGTGYSSLGLAADNDYLRLLGEIGIVGTLSFFLILSRLLEGMRNKIRAFKEGLTLEQVFIAGYLGSFIGFLANAIFIDVFEASKVAIVFWTLSGIAVGIVRKNA